MKIYDNEFCKRKKAEVMQAITPICNAFKIQKFDYIINEKVERLVLNDTQIGCRDNSISAVVDELVGYIFVTRWCRNRYLGAFKTQTLNRIREYWVKDGEPHA